MFSQVPTESERSPSLWRPAQGRLWFWDVTWTTHSTASPTWWSGSSLESPSPSSSTSASTLLMWTLSMPVSSDFHLIVLHFSQKYSHFLSFGQNNKDFINYKINYFITFKTGKSHFTSVLDIISFRLCFALVGVVFSFVHFTRIKFLYIIWPCL